MAEAAAAARPAGGALGTLWRFGRPHTLIGSALSVLGIFVIAADDLGGLPAGKAALHVVCTLLAALAVNVFITGINEITDVEIDRINKPWLPLASGELSVPAARRIVAVAAALPLVLAVTQGWIEVVAVGVALLIGWAYSCEPLRLKRFPVAASASISIVRSLVVNLGVALHVSNAFGAGTTVPPAVWALTLFVLPFSFAIAVLKDVPDLAGDSAFDVRTFTVRLGQRTALHMGMAALTVAYLGMAVLGPLLLDDAQPVVLLIPQLACLVVVWRLALRVDVEDPAAFTRFYMRVWGLFFLEYLLVPLAVLAG